MIVGNDAVNPITAMEDLNKLSVPFELSKFLNTDGTNGTKQKIFIDCTASETIAKEYVNILDQGFSVLAILLAATTEKP
jgi:hypothetical protein